MAKGLPKSIIKAYGITKKAWQVYRGAKKTRTVSVPQKGGVKVVKKRTKTGAKGKRKSGAFGGINLKELLFGAGLMTAGRIGVSKLAPGLPFQKQLGTAAGGMAASFTGLPGKKLINYALMDAGSEVLTSLLGGAGVGTNTTQGGYDY